MRRKAEAGFTLIELTLVAAILGLLAAIAIPKFSDLIEKAREAADLGSLGVIRSALNIYYADNEGTPPYGHLSTVLYPKYMAEPFRQWRPDHIPRTIRQPHLGDPFGLLPGFEPWISNALCGPMLLSSYIQNGGDDGSFLYKVNFRGEFEIRYNCTHLNLKGKPWSTY